MENSKKTRFNVIDLIIILALLAAVAGIFIRYNIADRIGVKNDAVTVEISFRISDMRPSSETAFTVGDNFIWDTNGVSLGTLSAITFSGAEAVVEKNDGTAVMTISDTRIDARGVIQATGTMTDEGFMLGGTQYLAPGKDVAMRSSKITVVAVVTDVTQIS